MDHHTGKEKWKRLDVAKLKDKNIGESDFPWPGTRIKRAYGNNGKEWPRLIVSILSSLKDSVHIPHKGNGSFHVACSRKEDPEDWWSECDIPISLGGDVAEMLREFLQVHEQPGYESNEAVYRDCVRFGTGTLKAAGIEATLSYKAVESDMAKILLQASNREVTLMLVTHKGDGAYPLTLVCGESYRTCKDGTDLFKKVRNYFGSSVLQDLVREELENRHVVAYTNGKPVYSHELPQ